MIWDNFTINADGKATLRDFDFRGADEATRTNLQIIKGALEELAEKLEGGLP